MLNRYVDKKTCGDGIGYITNNLISGMYIEIPEIETRGFRCSGPVHELPRPILLKVFHVIKG